MDRHKLHGKIYLFLIFAYICNQHLLAQNQVQRKDSVVSDTSLWVKSGVKPQIDQRILKFKPDPKKAVLYSLIFPGLGQIYNRKYWKLPLIYGGFLGLTYAVSWNSKYYNDYSKAYKDIMSSNPRTNDSWVDFLRPSITSASQLTDSQIESYQSIFKNKKDFYRRYRDLSIIGMVGLYALGAIDAYIDAELFDFDISDNVSMHVEPAVIPASTDKVNSNAIGINCNIKF